MPTADDKGSSSESEKEVAKEEVRVPPVEHKRILRKKISIPESSLFFKVFFPVVYALALASFTYHAYEDAPRTAVLYIFHRMLGVVYIIAFVSTWVQIIGLCGENGIEPIKDTMELVKKARKSKLSFPTVFWFGTATDRSIRIVCGVGLFTSILYTLNIVPTLALAISWIFFLSFKVVGQEFFALQFDNLLLDVGFFAFFLPPIRFLPFISLPVTHFYQNAIGWLVGWLGFRLMVGSGFCKITSGDKTWRNGTALCYHYWSQPMPNWISYYADALPLWLQRISCYYHFFVEIGVPFGLLFAPTTLPAFMLLASLQVGIIITGNYGHFNLLSILIPFLALKDSMFPQSIISLVYQLADTPSFFGGILSWILTIGVVAFVGLCLALSLVPFSIVARGEIWPLPSWLIKLQSKISPLGIFNYYGLFARMTTFRREVIIEGSDDGEEWKEYEFRYKVDNLTKHPRFVLGHLPRLDWRLWFCQFQQFSPVMSTWYDDFLSKLLQASPEVLSLLAKDPFHGEAPRYIRSVMYDYTFATPQDRAKGYWWQRSKRRLWWPPCTIDEKSGEMVYLMRSSLVS